MEAAFAAFMILGAKGKIKKHRKPGAPKPKKKLTKGQRRAAAKQRRTRMKAKKNLKKVSKWGKKNVRKIKDAGLRKVGPTARKAVKGVGSKIGKVAGKVGKLAGKLGKETRAYTSMPPKDVKNVQQVQVPIFKVGPKGSSKGTSRDIEDIKKGLSTAGANQAKLFAKIVPEALILPEAVM